jgi:hypothetical protein
MLYFICTKKNGDIIDRYQFIPMLAYLFNGEITDEVKILNLRWLSVLQFCNFWMVLYISATEQIYQEA